jgi:hypothetical protein
VRYIRAWVDFCGMVGCWLVGGGGWRRRRGVVGFLVNHGL